ncbi:hypothetical protein BD779DRAFT_929723 [Infundibulicybe gibba]|nr:hypothetical protein BD779DRAFT_929723 [Infundibulicybe gibba]
MRSRPPLLPMLTVPPRPRLLPPARPRSIVALRATACSTCLPTRSSPPPLHLPRSRLRLVSALELHPSQSSLLPLRFSRAPAPLQRSNSLSETPQRLLPPRDTLRVPCSRTPPAPTSSPTLCSPEYPPLTTKMASPGFRLSFLGHPLSLRGSTLALHIVHIA